jgi:hypothetical protein
MRVLKIISGYTLLMTGNIIEYGLLTLGFLLMLLLFVYSFIVATIAWVLTIPYHAYRFYQDAFDATLRKLPEGARKYIPIYDSYGLRHNHDFLQKKETVALVAQMTLTEQATFCDDVTRDMVKKMDLYFRSLQFIEQLQSIIPSQCNATSIGNLAYVALCTDSPHIFNHCNQVLLDIKIYFSDEKAEA